MPGVVVVVDDDEGFVGHALQRGVGGGLHAPAAVVMDDDEAILHDRGERFDEAVDGLAVAAVVDEIKPPRRIGLQRDAAQRARQEQGPVARAHDDAEARFFSIVAARREGGGLVEEVPGERRGIGRLRCHPMALLVRASSCETMGAKWVATSSWSCGVRQRALQAM